MVGILGMVAVTAPIWILLLRHFAISRVARVGLVVMAVLGGLTFGSMAFLGTVCTPAQDLAYGPEQCPNLPVPLIYALTAPMLAGLLTFIFWAPALIAVTALSEIRARHIAKTASAAAPSLPSGPPKD